MNKTFKEYLSEYLEYLKVTRNYSHHTVISYETDMLQFGEYIFKNENDSAINSGGDFADKKIDFSSLELSFLKSYIAELSDPLNFKKRYSRKTVSRKISVLKSFYKFIIKKKYIFKNTASLLLFPKTEKRLPSFMSETEMGNLLGDKYITELSILDKAIIELFYSTGIRLSELIDLKLANINFKNRTIKVFRNHGQKGLKKGIAKNKNSWQQSISCFKSLIILI